MSLSLSTVSSFLGVTQCFVRAVLISRESLTYVPNGPVSHIIILRIPTHQRYFLLVLLVQHTKMDHHHREQRREWYGE
jgi:hypothetical protein